MYKALVGRNWNVTGGGGEALIQQYDVLREGGRAHIHALMIEHVFYLTAD